MTGSRSCADCLYCKVKLELLTDWTMTGCRVPGSKSWHESMLRRLVFCHVRCAKGQWFQHMSDAPFEFKRFDRMPKSDENARFKTAKHCPFFSSMEDDDGVLGTNTNTNTDANN